MTGIAQAQYDALELARRELFVANGQSGDLTLYQQVNSVLSPSRTLSSAWSYGKRDANNQKLPEGVLYEVQIASDHLTEAEARTIAAVQHGTEVFHVLQLVSDVATGFTQFWQFHVASLRRMLLMGNLLVDLVSLSTSSYAPETGVVTKTETAVEVSAAVYDATNKLMTAATGQDASMIDRAERVLMLLAESCVLNGAAFTPQIGSKVNWPAASVGGTQIAYRITKVVPHFVGNAPLTYLVSLAFA